MIVAVAATTSSTAAVRSTIRSVRQVAPDVVSHVLDVDGTYVAQDGESVSSPAELTAHLQQLRLTHDDDAFRCAAGASWAAHLLPRGETVLVLSPGVVLLQRPEPLGDLTATSVALVRAVAPGVATADAPSVLSTEVYALAPSAAPSVGDLTAIVDDWRTADRFLDLFLARVPHRVVVDDAALVSRWNSGPTTLLGRSPGGGLTKDGREVTALDLSGLDPVAPWLFDARPGPSSGPLLSRNEALAALITGQARERAADVQVRRHEDAVVRSIARTAVDAGEELPDPAGLDEWLLELVPAAERAPVARYLAGIYATRPDLRATFPFVPGRDSALLAGWARDHGLNEPAYDAGLLARAAELTAGSQPAPEPAGVVRQHGVNLVGYLSGELGVGTSARLMDAALLAADVPTSTFAVTRDLQSRTAATYRHTEAVRYDTTLVAVNADQTPSVVGALEDVVAGTYRIGMWYWEVEAFPADRDAAFAHVDEVWAATDFVRDAIAARSPVPVRTVLPPLPQRSAGEPPAIPERLGIPTDRPWFFFAFDYLSTAERKNPWGLVEAFSRAFRPGEGPVLVIKTINAERRLAEAERLRILAAQRPDVRVIDEYLEADELTALSARCTAYVSLHRAEGLGLTIAEAMAWGRPVVVSAYSGNTQFTTSSNSFLVPCSPTPIPEGAEPYPAGTPWAAPDLDAAAAHLRRIVEDPAAARAVGQRAADDIRVLHSPQAAARRVAEALGEARARLDERLRAEAVAESASRQLGARAARLAGRLRRGVVSRPA